MEGQVFPQSAAGTLSEEPSLPTPTENDESSPDGPELLALSTTGNVRAPVVPEIQASPREVGLLLTSDRSGPLDHNSTVILPGAEPLSPSKWKCDPHSETLPMAESRLLTPVAPIGTSSQSTQVRDLATTVASPAPTPPQPNKQALTLVTTSVSDTSGAVEKMAPLVSDLYGSHDDDDMIVTDDDMLMQTHRVQDWNDNISVSEHGYQPPQLRTTYDKLFDRSSDTIIDSSAENRPPTTIHPVRTSSPRSPGMPSMHDRPSVFRPVEARHTPLHSRASTRHSGRSHAASRLGSRAASRASIVDDWLGPIVTKIVDDTSERDRRREQREHEERIQTQQREREERIRTHEERMRAHDERTRAQQREEQLTEQALQLMKTEIEQVKQIANQRMETEILRKEKELLERQSEIQKQLTQKETELELVKVQEKQQLLLKEKEFAQTQADKEIHNVEKQKEFLLQREKEQTEIILQREADAYELMKQRERENMLRAEKELELAITREKEQAELATQREDKLRRDLYNYADLKAKAALLEQQVKDYKSFTQIMREVSTGSLQQSDLELPPSTATLVAPPGSPQIDYDGNFVWPGQTTMSTTGNSQSSLVQSTAHQRQLAAQTATVSATGTHPNPTMSDLSLPHHSEYHVVPTQTAVTMTQSSVSSTFNLVPITTATFLPAGSVNILDTPLSGNGGQTQPLMEPLLPTVVGQMSTSLLVDQYQNPPNSSTIQQQPAVVIQPSQALAINTPSQSASHSVTSQKITGANTVNVPNVTQTSTSFPVGQQQPTTVQQSLPTIVVNTPQPVRPYKGTTSWSSFRDHFTRIATVNGWATDAIKAQHLMISLEGPAAEILKEVDETSPTLYQDIWQLLSKRFGEVNEQREAMRKFEQRRQQDNETVVEFEQTLRSLYRKAWPNATPQQKEVALKTRFEEGLLNLDMQQYLRLHAAADTFEQTVQKARIFATTVDNPRPKKSVRISTPPPDSVQTISDSSLHKRMDKIEGMIRSLQVKPERPSTPPPKSSSAKSFATNQQSYRSQSPGPASSGNGYRGREKQQQRPPKSGNQNGQEYARSFSDRPNNYQSRSPTPTRQSGQQTGKGGRPQNSYNYQTGPSKDYQQRSYSPGPPTNNGQRQWYNSGNQQRPSTPNQQQRPVSPRQQQWTNTNYQQRPSSGRPVYCYVCGELGCHSSFHRGQSTPPPVNRPPRTGKRGCFVCGLVGCHSELHNSDQTRQGNAPNESDQTVPKQYQQGNVQGTRSPGNRGPQ